MLCDEFKPDADVRKDPLVGLVGLLALLGLLGISIHPSDAATSLIRSTSIPAYMNMMSFIISYAFTLVQHASSLL